MSDIFSQRAKEIFEEARQLPPQQRERYLEQACGEDAELRAQLRALLEAHSAPGGFLESPTFEPADRCGSDSKTRLAEETPGTVIGRYKLLQSIGEGGFGRVFMAEQTEPVQRRVALKIIKLGMDTRQVIARFEAERQALAMMDHPNIAKVLDAGATPEGRPFFVMELVRGEPITEYCDKNNLDVPKRLELFSAVCNAVQHAHQKGIIHRDIKPTNVLVTMADGKPVPKVIDFGIAKATSARLTEKTLFTEFRHLIGTPAYMSPEQAEASGVDIDTRSDIYSLGVLLYELLTGTTPFDPKRLHSAAYAEIQRIIREEEPPKPSTRLSTLETLPAVAAHRHTEPAKLSRTIRGDLDWIVMKCLEKDRTRRYETANALALDIQRHLSDEPVLAGPPGSIYRIHKFVRKHRIGVLATGAIAAVLLLGVSGTTWGMLKANKEAKRATAAANRASLAEEAERRRANELEQVATFQAAQFEGIDTRAIGLDVREKMVADVIASMERSGLPPEQLAKARADLDQVLAPGNPTNVAVRALYDHIFARTLNSINKQFADQPLVRASLLQTLGHTLLRLGLLEEARRPLSDALSLRREILGNRHEDTLRSVRTMGWLLKEQHQFEEAEHYLREALEGRRQLYGDVHGDTLDAINGLASILMLQGKAEADVYYAEALEVGRALFGPEAPEVLTTIMTLAMMHRKEGRFAEAESYYRQGLDTYRRLVGDKHRATLTTMFNLGHMVAIQGRPDEAEVLLAQALEGRRSLLGDDHPETLVSILQFGDLRRNQGKLTEAVSYYQEALDGYSRLMGSADSSAFRARRSLARAYVKLGRHDEARSLWRDYLEILAEMASARPGDAESINEIAWALLTVEMEDLRDPQRALAYAQRACALAEPKGHPKLWWYLDTLALAQHQTGDTQAAIETQQRAIALVPPSESQESREELQGRLKEFEAAVSPPPSTLPSSRKAS